MKKSKTNIPAMDILAAIGGVFVAGIVSKNLAATVTDPKTRSLIPVAAGIALTLVKQPLIKTAGIGMAAKGANDFLKEQFPALIGQLTDDVFLSNPADQSILSAPADQSVLSAPSEDDYLGEDPEMIGLDDAEISGYDGSEDYI